MKETKNTEEFSWYHNLWGNVKSMTVMGYVAKKVYVILPSHSSGNRLNDFKEAGKASVRSLSLSWGSFLSTHLFDALAKYFWKEAKLI